MKKLVLFFVTLIISYSLLHAQHHMGQEMDSAAMNQNNMMNNPMMKNMMQPGMMPMMMQHMMQSGMMPMQNMMRGSMMGNMMSSSGMMMGGNAMLRPQMMLINRLPEMYQPLSLSEDQLEQLIDLQASYKKYQISQKAKINEIQSNLQNQCRSDASMDELRNTLTNLTEAISGMMMHTLETAKDMKTVLNDQQKEKLKNMMSAQMGMMQNMNMNQMGGDMQ